MADRILIRDFEQADPRDGGASISPRPDELGLDALFGSLSAGSSHDGSSAGVRSVLDTGTVYQYHSYSAADGIAADTRGAELRFRAAAGDGFETIGGAVCTMAWDVGTLRAQLFISLVERFGGELFVETESFDGATQLHYELREIDPWPFVDQWWEVIWLPTGAWSFGPVGGSPLYSGTLATPQELAATNAGFSVKLEKNFSAPVMVDNVHIWLEPPPTIVGEPELVRRAFV